MPDVNEAAVLIAKEETKQTEAIADAQIKTEEIRAEAQEKAAEAIAETVTEKAKAETRILGMWTEAELLEILDECGRHIMTLEAQSGGGESSPSEDPANSSTTTVVESVPGTSSAPAPDSPSGTEAPATSVTIVETPVKVSEAEVTSETKRKGGFWTLMFGNSR